jgi:hypothetical protein
MDLKVFNNEKGLRLLDELFPPRYFDGKYLWFSKPLKSGEIVFFCQRKDGIIEWFFYSDNAFVNMPSGWLEKIVQRLKEND